MPKNGCAAPELLTGDMSSCPGDRTRSSHNVAAQVAVSGEPGAVFHDYIKRVLAFTDSKPKNPPHYRKPQKSLTIDET